MVMSTCLACVMAVLVMAAGPAHAWGANESVFAYESTQDFVRTASISNMFEIESSRLALRKSRNTQVKQFAQHMITDHTKTGAQLKQVLQSSHSNARMTTRLDNKHQQLLSELQHTSGPHFDSDYIKIQTEAHKEAVTLFRNYSKEGREPAIKQFAARTLPTLEDHLNQAEHL